MQPVEKFNFFLITKDNWKKQNNVFYGYRTVENEGFWIELYNNKKELIINTSLISPIIAIYQKDSFWAISNSIKYLYEYIKENNLELTQVDINPNYYYYTEQETNWKEIKLTPCFSNLIINDDGIQLINKTFDKIEKEQIVNILDKWVIKYSSFLKTFDNRDNLVVQLSGGMDSRFLMHFWKDLNIKRVSCNWQKGNEPKDWLNDGIIGQLACYKFSNINKDKLSDPVKKENILKSLYTYNDKDIIDDSYFWFGSTKEVFTRHYTEIKSTISYSLTGVGTEYLKQNCRVTLGNVINNTEYLTAYFRRTLIPRFLRDYYIDGRINILPYVDSLLIPFCLSNFNNPLLLTILFIKYNPEFLTVPFTVCNSAYWLSDNLLALANDLLKQQKESSDQKKILEK